MKSTQVVVDDNGVHSLAEMPHKHCSNQWCSARDVRAWDARKIVATSRRFFEAITELI